MTAEHKSFLFICCTLSSYLNETAVKIIFIMMCLLWTFCVTHNAESEIKRERERERERERILLRPIVNMMIHVQIRVEMIMVIDLCHLY